MTPNYDRPAFSPCAAKPPRGSRVLEKERHDADALKHEFAVKKDVKRRDGRCRWPAKHTCRGGLECAHIVDASLGGAMASENLVLVCAWIHRRGPDSIHGKQLKIDKDTALGANGPLSFWMKGEDGIFYLVRRELKPFVYERD